MNQGRVEICYNKTWGTICDDAGWINGGISNAQVVCRQLGLQYQSKMAIYNSISFL